MRVLLRFLDRRSRSFNIALSFAVLAFIGLIDTVTPKPIGFSFFYLVPIAIATWYGSRGLGVLMAILSALTWGGSDIYSAGGYANLAVPLWNATVRFGSYFAMAYLLAALYRSLEHEKDLARTDFLTGLANSRCFSEVCETEAQRARRYDRPMTLVYIDVDDFKAVNDRFGHQGGDRLLKCVGDAIRATMRHTDTAARWGGDEFVILLPETDADQARVAVHKLHTQLLTRANEGGWGVTFSIGVGTLRRPEGKVDDFVARADALMYLAKRQGKDSVRYEVWGPDSRDERTA